MPETPLRLVFNPTGALREAAEECEAEVFLAWYGNTRKQLQEEYSPYATDSVFLAVVDHRDTALGAMRVILPTHGHLKSLDDVADDPWRLDGRRSARAADVDPDATWDLATIGVRKGQTGTRLMIAAALYHGVFMAYRANAFRSVVAIVDENVRALGEAIGLHLHALPGASTGPYLGSPASTPVYGVCAAMLDTQRRTCPDGYRLLVHGVGLDGIAIPEPPAFRVTPVPAPAGRQSRPGTDDAVRAAARWN